MASNDKHSDAYYRALAHESDLVDDDGGVDAEHRTFSSSVDWSFSSSTLTKKPSGSSLASI